MNRRCFIVSRTLRSGNPDAKVAKWRAIGNGHAVPKINEAFPFPFLEHWALCILPPASDAKTSSPSAREAFLNADYFDLGASRETASRIVSQSDSYMSFVNPSTKWRPAAVMDISTVLYVGRTARSNDWILERARFLIRNWGTYRPFLWNCQHFAVFIAQITIATGKVASTMNGIMLARHKFVKSVRTNRHMGCMAGLGASAFVPAIGPALAFCFWATAGFRMVLDSVKDEQIISKWKEFREKYEELRKISI